MRVQMLPMQESRSLDLFDSFHDPFNAGAPGPIGGPLGVTVCFPDGVSGLSIFLLIPGLLRS